VPVRCGKFENRRRWLVSSEQDSIFDNARSSAQRDRSARFLVELATQFFKAACDTFRARRPRAGLSGGVDM
jgi:hypothetical protein